MMSVFGRSRIRARWVQGAVLGGVSLVALALLLPLWLEVTDRLDQMRSARRDNVIWTITQLEVEYLELEKATMRLDPVTAEGLPELRRRFNVFYSRLGTLQQSPIYRSAIVEAGEATNLDAVFDRVNLLLPLLDGPDRDLMAARDDLLVQLGDLRVPIRRVVANANFVLTSRIEAAREEAARLVGRLGFASLLLFGGLFGLATLFLRLYITYKRRAKENLLTSQRLSTVIATSPDAIIVTDDDGRIRDFNPAAEALLAYARARALGMELSTLIRPETARTADLPSRAQNFFRRSMTGIKQDGQTVPLEVSQGATSLGQQRVYVYFLRDITERLLAEEALRRSRDKALAGERAKAHFLAVMSHEMRTPLNGILGVVELLRDSVISPKDRHYLSLLENSGQVLLGHVNEVLDITEIEARGIRLTIAPLNLDALLEEVVETLRPAAEAKGNRIALTRAPEPLGRVMGDLMRLRQIVANLLSNAIKFTKDGQIEVSVSLRESVAGVALEIQVSDTGIGIDEAQQPEVFDDFVRLGRGRNSQVEGTGLGLGIVRRLVSAMGGRIGVDSIKGEGSLFWVTLNLPRARATEITPEPPLHDHDPVGPDDRPLDVLLVEDNPTNRFVLREMLEQAGHRVVEAQNGQIGADIARDQAFDVILMDINMPMMGGVEATRLIRASGACQQTRIVALTAHVLDQDTQLYREVGIDRVISKPISRRLIAQVLRGESQELAPVRVNKTLDAVVLDQLSRSLTPARAAQVVMEVIAEGDQFDAALDDATTIPVEDLLHRVHVFAGSCAMIGAVRLRNTLARLEETLRQQPHEDLRPWVAPLHVLWRETRLELLSHTQAQAGPIQA